MNGSVLSVDRLSKNFGKVLAVAEVSFAIPKGSITAFLGRNGAGKTTTLKMILGFLRPDAGRVEHKATRIGYVPERPVFFPWLRGQEILCLTARAFGLSKRTMEEKTKEQSRAISFDTRLLSRRVQTYSMGNQKKFSYLQSLVTSPDLLIVDEPFSGLDPVSIKDIRDLFLSLKKKGQTLVLSSHLMAETEKICDEFIILKQGRVAVQSGLRDFRDNHLWASVRLLPPVPGELLTWSRSVRTEDGTAEILIARNRRPAFEHLLSEQQISAEIRAVDLERIFLFFA
jgi:ABC-2 type transport system ATP-binding protein